ncbi:MAG: STAS domain-containing protein [Candidatus Eremiobacteraeota bacterium]|nr:STAS domain-containing protein [Candidatus Eremiobacteraeota bacterium]
MSGPSGTGGSFEPPPIVVIKLKGGEYDIARRDELAAELKPGGSAQTVILDFADVTFADSTALGCLMNLRKQMAEHHPNPVIRVMAVSPTLYRLFDITGMTKIFDIVPVE